MAKKKQKKEKEKFEYTDEILGILFVLLSIIGILGYGRAGNFIRSFAVFLVGILYVILLIAILVLGLYIYLQTPHSYFSPFSSFNIKKFLYPKNNAAITISKYDKALKLGTIIWQEQELIDILKEVNNE